MLEVAKRPGDETMTEVSIEPNADRFVAVRCDFLGSVG
jgi:hypothetical protein